MTGKLLTGTKRINTNKPGQLILSPAYKHQHHLMRASTSLTELFCSLQIKIPRIINKASLGQHAVSSKFDIDSQLSAVNSLLTTSKVNDTCTICQLYCTIYKCLYKYPLFFLFV